MILTYQKLYEGEIVNRVTSGLIKLYAPISGDLKRLKVIVNNASALSGTWYLNVYVNGVPVLSGTGTGAANMLRLTSSEYSSEKNVEVAVVEGDVIHVSVIVTGAGGLAAPIAFIFDIDDGVVYVEPTSTLFATRELDQVSKSVDHEFELSDSGKQILHPTDDDNPRTFTIPDDDDVEFPIGTAITVVNEINGITVEPDTDTLVHAGVGPVASIVVTAHGVATLFKTGTTKWTISGIGIE